MRKSGFLRAISAVIGFSACAVVFAQAPAAPPAGAHKEITLPHATLARYVGAYELSPQAILNVTLEGEQLQTQMTGQDKVPVFAESETKFFPKLFDAQLEFKLGAGGEVTALVLHQGGMDVEARRSGTAAPKVVEHKEVKLAPDVLALYPGTYAGNPLSFTVTLENGQLQLQASGQQKVELFAETQDKFFLKVVEAQIEFVREAGKVKALILHQGPATLRAERQ